MQVSTGVARVALVAPCIPNDVAADGASVPFWAEFTAVCTAPLRVSVVFQPLTTRSLPAHVQVTVHDFVATVPVDVTLADAVKPPVQLLSVCHAAVHAAPLAVLPVVVVAVTTADAAEALPAASRARTV